MSILFEAVEPMSQVVHIFNRHDEDTADRMNHKYSTIQFIILAIVVTTNQYVGEIIKCWAPAQFPESWVEYTNSICWISNTYYIPMDETNILKAPRQEIVYYQWVPLVLFLQAFLFYLPYVNWAVFNRSIGLDINKIGQACRQMENLNPEARDKTTKYLVKHIDRSLMYTREIRTGACANAKATCARYGCFCGKRHGTCLISIYMITKLLYITNAICQMYLMNHFLGTNYTIYGIEVIRDIATQGDYKESVRFPRVTLCDFHVRAVGKNIPYSVQCTLPVNLFNEKIFIFVWFWLALMALVSTVSFFGWLWILFTTNRRGFIRKYLKVFNKYDKETDKARLVMFCDQYLRQDGHFALRMIGKNTNELVVGELISALWENYNRKHFFGRKMNV